MYLKGGNEMGIVTYSVFANVRDFKELKADIWSEDAIPAVMKVHKKRYEIGLTLRGSHIREMRKKSYYVEFYSPKKFGQTNEIHLNAEYKDPSLVRNKLSLDFFSDLGVLSPKSQFVHLTINGKNEGVYLQLESVNEYFLTKRNLPKGSIFYAVDGDANFSLMSDLDEKPKESLQSGYETKVAYGADEEALEYFIYNLNTWTNQEFEDNIEKHLEVDRYLAWLVGVICLQNFDGFVHNYALYRNSDTKCFELLPWDYDATWGRDVNGDEMESNYVRMEGFNTLTARLLAISKFKNQYIKKMNSVLDHQFTVNYMKPRVEDLHQLILPYVEKDPYLQHKLATFYQEPAFICNFIKEREAYLRKSMKSF